ncbi:MAG: hypothetical protein VCA38_03740 [Roseibacillus sp.]|jgi:hypothetical protein
MSTVRCKECNEEARLEEVYHAHYQGFRCKRCNARHEGELFAIGGILILACLLVFVATMVVNSLTGPKAEATFDTGASYTLVDGKGGIERTEIITVHIERAQAPENPPSLSEKWNSKLLMSSLSMASDYRDNPDRTELDVDEILHSPGVILVDTDLEQEVLILDADQQWYRLAASKEITHGPGQQPPPPEQPNLLLPHNQERPAPRGEMRDFH